jgi:hypothetical protein
MKYTHVQYKHIDERKKKTSNGMLLMIRKAREKKKEQTNVCILVNQRIERERERKISTMKRKISLLLFRFFFDNQHQ